MEGDDEFRINREMLLELCAKSTMDMYETPELNNSLYLQNKNIPIIENLEDYVNVTWLYLQQNCIDKIENLGHFRKLTGLYLGNNGITKIENLEKNTKLKTLSLDQNFLTTVKGVEDCKGSLEFLSATDNNIKDISSLACCHKLSTLKLQRNKITDPDMLLKTLSEMKGLKSIYLKGNPVVPKIKDYRKTIIDTCKQLVYLDDRPVYDWERRFINAWKIGGQEALNKERDLHNAEKAAAAEKEMREWKKAREEMKAKLKAENTISKPKETKTVVQELVDQKFDQDSLGDESDVKNEGKDEKRSACMIPTKNGKDMVQVVWKGGAGARESPKDSAPIKEILPFGSVLEVKGSSNGWVQHSKGWTKAMAAPGMPVFTTYVPEVKKELNAKVSEIPYRRTKADEQANIVESCKMQWDSKMDKELLQLTRKYHFDFAVVSSKLKSAIVKKGMGVDVSNLDENECRCRFSELDEQEQRRDEDMNGYDPYDLNWDEEGTGLF